MENEENEALQSQSGDDKDRGQTAKKRKRGRYKQYSQTGTVPRSTLFSRRKLLEAQRLATSTTQSDTSSDSETERLGGNHPLVDDDDVSLTPIQRTVNTETSSTDEEHEGSGNSVHVSNCEQSSYDEESGGDENSDLEDSQGDGSCHGFSEQAASNDSEKQQYYITRYHLLDKLHQNFPLSRLDVLLMILNLAIRHCHTEHFIQDQIRFVNTLFGEEVLDISYHIFKNLFPSSESIQRHYYCDVCEIYLGPQENFPKDIKFSSCPKCKKDIAVQSIDSKNFFITLSVKQQIESLLKRLDVKLVSKDQRNDDFITDIFDGKLYRKCCEEGFPFENVNALTVTFNTDGVKVLENSEYGGLWPVLLHLNEIVPELRFKTENLILGGLWCGKAAPNMSLFLKPFMNQLLDLSHDSVIRHTQCDGTVVMRPVFAIGCSLDSVAKAKVLCQRQFNGGHSCLYCYHPNNAVADSNSKIKHFDTTVSYPSRKEIEVIGDMLEADRLQQEGQLKDSSVRGFLGISPLLMLCNLQSRFKCNPFNVIWGVVIDYLHALLEGICSDLLKLYRSVLTPEQIRTLNRRLDQINLPQGMSRKPRHISDKIKYKAKEFRSFFLYFALPCFEDLLPCSYFLNLKLFVNAMHVLLADKISKRELLEVKVDLDNFMRGFQNLFGLQNVTYNLHLCSHLADLVLHMGPLWCYSNFVFESGNGMISRLVRGTRSIINEVATKFTRLQSAFTCINDNPINDTALDFCRKTVKCKFLKCDKYCDVSVTGSQSYILVSDEESTLFEAHGIPLTNGKVRVFNRVIRNGILYCSKSYSKVRVTDDTCAVLHDTTYVIIDKIISTYDNVLKCLVKPIRISDGPPLTASVKKCSFNPFGDLCIIDFNDISKKCIFMSFDSKHFVCHIPNFFERD